MSLENTVAAFCRMLPAIHIAPYHFSYFLFCPSSSLFYSCIFHCILGLVALTVSECPALSCLVAVILLSLRSTCSSVLLMFPLLVFKNSCCSFVLFGLLLLLLLLLLTRPSSSSSSLSVIKPAVGESHRSVVRSASLIHFSNSSA